MRIQIGSLDVAGGAVNETKGLSTGQGSLGHRHDTVIVFRLHLLKVKLKVSRELIVRVIVSCATPIV